MITNQRRFGVAAIDAPLSLAVAPLPFLRRGRRRHPPLGVDDEAEIVAISDHSSVFIAAN